MVLFQSFIMYWRSMPNLVYVLKCEFKFIIDVIKIIFKIMSASIASRKFKIFLYHSITICVSHASIRIGVVFPSVVLCSPLQSLPSWQVDIWAKAFFITAQYCNVHTLLPSYSNSYQSCNLHQLHAYYSTFKK